MNGDGLGDAVLNQARELLHSLQNEEQIVLNQRMRNQEWAAQSTQILDLLPKLERSVIELQKEKRAYLLTGENNFAEAYKRAAAAFSNYHGYLSILVTNSGEQAALLADVRSQVETWANEISLPEMNAKRAGRDPRTPSLRSAAKLDARHPGEDRPLPEERARCL